MARHYRAVSLPWSARLVDNVAAMPGRIVESVAAVPIETRRRAGVAMGAGALLAVVAVTPAHGPGWLGGSDALAAPGTGVDTGNGGYGPSDRVRSVHTGPLLVSGDPANVALSQVIDNGAPTWISPTVSSITTASPISSTTSPASSPVPPGASNPTSPTVSTPPLNGSPLPPAPAGASVGVTVAPAPTARVTVSATVPIPRAPVSVSSDVQVLPKGKTAAADVAVQAGPVRANADVEVLPSREQGKVAQADVEVDTGVLPDVKVDTGKVLPGLDVKLGAK